jgi:hypothetical protein
MKLLSKLLLLLALSVSPAFGQCAMCYSSAKGASHGGQTAITRGVLTLLLPPIGMMMGLVGFAFRYNRNGQREEEPGLTGEDKDSADSDSQVRKLRG